MKNTLSCFGVSYAETAIECIECGAQKECKRKMSNGHTLPCWGDYNEKSYACTDVCTYGGAASAVSLCANAQAGSSPPEVDPLAPNTVAEPIIIPADEGASEAVEITRASGPPVSEPAVVEAEVVEAEVVEAEVVEAEVAEPEVAEPEVVERLPRKPKVAGKLKKKDVIINALSDAPADGIAADDIVDLIHEAGLADITTPDKTRHSVIMTVSGLRKAGWDVQSKNRKYVLVAKGA